MALALRYLLPGGIGGTCGEQRATRVTTEISKKPFMILLVAAVLRSWAIFAAITYLPMYLVQQGYTLVVASTLVTLMLLAGVGGQITGGYVSDRYGRKEFMVLGLACSIPTFCLFFFTTGIVSIIGMLPFGFALWSTFAVAVAMSHEHLPQNVGLASGMMLGLAIGVGGLGVAVNGIIADNYSLATALGTIPLPIGGAVLMMIMLPYPWKALKRRFANNALP